MAGSEFSDTNLVGRVLGDSAARAEMEDLLNTQKAEVLSLLTANRHLVETLRDALLEQQELVGREILDVLERANAEREPLQLDLRTAGAAGTP